MGNIGNIGAMLPYLGAGASGFMQGKQQGYQMQRQRQLDDLDMAYKQQQMQDMAARIKAEMDPYNQASPELGQAMTSIEPHFNLPNGGQGLEKGDLMKIFEGFQNRQTRLQTAGANNAWKGFQTFNDNATTISRLESVKSAIESHRNPNGMMDQQIALMSPDLKAVWDRHSGHIDDMLAEVNDALASAYDARDAIGAQLQLPRGPRPPSARGNGSGGAGGPNPFLGAKAPPMGGQ